MTRIFLAFSIVFALAGCSSPPSVEDEGTVAHLPEYGRGSRSAPARRTPVAPRVVPAPLDPAAYWKNQLGMNRQATDLGFAERRFTPCAPGSPEALAMDPECGPRYLTVIHFQLLCRDSVGTVQDVPVTMQPLRAAEVGWTLGDASGRTSTDPRGYGQLVMVTPSSASGKRLTLRIGKQFMGFTASEMTRVVLPANFCG